MNQDTESKSYKVALLTVSGSATAGVEEDIIARTIPEYIKQEQFFGVSTFLRSHCFEWNCNDLEEELIRLSDDVRVDLILTVGGTGFSPLHLIPEATVSIIDREAPYLAYLMIQSCYEKSKLAVLNRCECGMRRNTLILNLPSGAEDSLTALAAVGSLIPHALDQLKAGTVSNAPLPNLSDEVYRMEERDRCCIS